MKSVKCFAKVISYDIVACTGESESKCDSVTASRETEEDAEESEDGRGELGLVSDAPSASFPLDAHGSAGEDRSSPVGDSMDRLDPGECSSCQEMDSKLII